MRVVRVENCTWHYVRVSYCSQRSEVLSRRAARLGRPFTLLPGSLQAARRASPIGIRTIGKPLGLGAPSADPPVPKHSPGHGVWPTTGSRRLHAATPMRPPRLGIRPLRLGPQRNTPDSHPPYRTAPSGLPRSHCPGRFLAKSWYSSIRTSRDRWATNLHARTA